MAVNSRSRWDPRENGSSEFLRSRFLGALFLAEDKALFLLGAFLQKKIDQDLVGEPGVLSHFFEVRHDMLIEQDRDLLLELFRVGISLRFTENVFFSHEVMSS